MQTSMEDIRDNCTLTTIGEAPHIILTITPSILYMIRGTKTGPVRQKTREDAMRLRDHIVALIESAHTSQERLVTLHIVVKCAPGITPTPYQEFWQKINEKFDSVFPQKEVMAACHIYLGSPVLVRITQAIQKFLPKEAMSKLRIEKESNLASFFSA